MINCRSPVDKFHSLRRQSFHSLTAVGLPPRRSPLSWAGCWRREGGEQADVSLATLDLTACRWESSVSETLKGGHWPHPSSQKRCVLCVMEILLICTSQPGCVRLEKLGKECSCKLLCIEANVRCLLRSGSAGLGCLCYYSSSCLF